MSGSVAECLGTLFRLNEPRQRRLSHAGSAPACAGGRLPDRAKGASKRSELLSNRMSGDYR